MAGKTFVAPETWYAQLPTCYAVADALITDTAGRVLLVKQNYRPHWALPGGIVESDEPPHVACVREVAEELGLTLTLGPLLLVDWAPAMGRRPRPLAYFLFDGGTLESTSVQSIQLEHDELDAYDFFTPDDALARLAPHTAHRLPAALDARRTRTTAYLPSTANGSQIVARR